MTLPLVSGCVAGTATEFCAVAAPIFVSRDDVLTTETVRQIVTFNETWEALCHAQK